MKNRKANGKKTWRLKIDATALVKWENRAAAAGMSLTRYVSLFLADKVQRT